MFSSTKNSHFNASSFRIVKDPMLQADELPLAEVIDDEKWQVALDRCEVSFGTDPASIDTPAITLWALISQVFFKEEHRGCKAAVGRVASWWATLGKIICSTNTGAYCRARLKIPFEAVRDIAVEIALTTEAAYQQQAPEDDRGELHPILTSLRCLAISPALEWSIQSVRQVHPRIHRRHQPLMPSQLRFECKGDR